MALYREVLDERKGRCAVTLVALRAGSCVLRTTSVCAVSYSSCGWCFAIKETLQRCAGCRNVRYCSRTCQQQDWSQHQRECFAWRSIPASTTSHTILLVTRLAAKLYLSPEANEEKNRVLKLRHHLADHSEAQRQQFREMMQLVLLLLSRYKIDNKAQISGFQTFKNELEIMKLFGRVNCNAFTIADNVTNKATGIGLFPDGALFNHDCDPNCVVTFKDREMLVYVVKDVDVGQELTVSYIELLQSRKARQRELQESYYFECECARCLAAIREETAEDWFLDGLVCSNKECVDGVVIVSTNLNGKVICAVCKQCGLSRNPEEINRYYNEIEMIEERKVSEQDQWIAYQRQWEIAINRLKLHPRNALVAVVARKVGNFLLNATSKELHRYALQFCMAELRAVDWLLPQTKLPSRGLLHLQIGKLLYEKLCRSCCTEVHGTRAGQFQKAKKHLQQALVTLNCACGSASAAVKFAQIMLDEVRRAAR